MPFAIELRLDREAEIRVFEIWAEASRFYQTDYLLKNGVIPHVALLVGDERLQSAFETLEVPIERLKLSDIGFFGEGEIAYLRAEISEGIRVLQKQAYDAAVRLGAEVDPYYRPDNWIPHCTIAQGCRARQKEPVEFLTITTRLGSLILVEYPPTKLIAERMAK